MNVKTHRSNVLTFVCSEDDFSVYRDSDGEEVYLQHGTGKRLVDLDDLNLDAFYQAWLRAGNSQWDTPGFCQHLADSITDPERVEYEIVFCHDCAVPEGNEGDDMIVLGNGERVCDECSGNYWGCNTCEELFKETRTTLHDDEACESCLENRHYFCDHCDGYYYYEFTSDHDHDEDDCDCESPAQVFSIPNGNEMLANDTNVTVSLPAGVISDEGIGAIAVFLRMHRYGVESAEERDALFQVSLRLSELGEQWQTKQGNFTKRLSRFAYKEYGLKIQPDVMSKVGTIAREHSTSVDFTLATTRNLNLPREDFAHEGSCWWTEYSESRCALKTNGGFGLRTFSTRTSVYNSSHEYDSVEGRAWVMPLKWSEVGGFEPTFNTETPDAYVVFNGYGDLEGYKPARLLSHMTGMTYRKVTFGCDPMYVNSDSGYLVAPEAIAAQHTDGRVQLSVNQHSNLHYREQQTAATCNHFEPCNHDEKVLTHVA